MTFYHFIKTLFCSGSYFPLLTFTYSPKAWKVYLFFSLFFHWAFLLFLRWKRETYSRFCVNPIWVMLKKWILYWISSKMSIKMTHGSFWYSFLMKFNIESIFWASLKLDWRKTDCTSLVFIWEKEEKLNEKTKRKINILFMLWENK